MGINLVTFYNSTVTPQDDALIYENALPGSGMIYGGNCTIKNANTIHVTAGHGALCGRKFTIEETDVPVILTSSGTLNGRLYIHMDLSDTENPISLEVERANVLTPVVQQSNVNINDGVYEINLATFTISTSTISNLVYVAPFIKSNEAREVIIAPVEASSVASQSYAVGRHLILNKILYRVIQAISPGQTITPGTNVTTSNSVEEQIEDANSSISTINSNITTINSNKANQTVIATRQANLTASRAYAIGEQFIYNNTLYRATAAIAKNATITIGGNATAADNITTQISNLNKYAKVNFYEMTTRNGNPDTSVFATVNSNFLTAGYITIIKTEKQFTVHFGGITGKTGNDWPFAVVQAYKPFLQEYFWYNNSGTQKRGYIDTTGYLMLEGLTSGNQISGTVSWNKA